MGFVCSAVLHFLVFSTGQKYNAPNYGVWHGGKCFVWIAWHGGKALFCCTQQLQSISVEPGLGVPSWLCPFPNLAGGWGSLYTQFMGWFWSHRLRLHEEKVIKDRRHHLKTYPNCFVAKELIDWLIDHKEASDRETAIKLVQKLLDHSIIHHGKCNISSKLSKQKFTLCSSLKYKTSRFLPCQEEDTWLEGCCPTRPPVSPGTPRGHQGEELCSPCRYRREVPADRAAASLPPKHPQLHTVLTSAFITTVCPSLPSLLSLHTPFLHFQLKSPSEK